MARTYSRYSRMIAWLKIILPLGALALLSTIFLLSSEVDPTSNVPFSVVGIDGDIAREEVREPRFAGTTSAGASLLMTAKVARPSPSIENLLEADELTAQIVMQDGSEIDMTAPRATLSDERGEAELKGGVRISSSTGYTLTTQSMLTSLERVEAESRGQVDGDGPLGTLRAGRMQITTPDEGKTVHLLFTGGVKLVYVPRTE